jgi:hypothetical protein
VDRVGGTSSPSELAGISSVILQASDYIAKAIASDDQNVDDGCS